MFDLKQPIPLFVREIRYPLNPFMVEDDKGGRISINSKNAKLFQNLKKIKKPCFADFEYLENHF